MSTNETQARLLGGPSGDSVSIETSGRTIRPALQIPATLVDEFKPEFAKDGIHITTMDPANVGLVDMTIYPEAFEDYYVDADDSVLVGIYLEGLRSKLSNARLGKTTNDPVEVDIDETRTLIEIERDYRNSTVRYADEQLNIDPDSIRERPDMPELETPGTAELEVEAFKDAIEHMDTSTDHIVVRERDGSLVFTGGSHDDSPSKFGSATEFDGLAQMGDDADDPVSKFSLDYLVDYARALKKAKVDTITLRWGDSIPVYLEFERTEDETTLYSGTVMLAPRLHEEDTP